MKPTPPKDLWAKMDDLMGGLRVESEGYTINELAKRYGLGISQTQKKATDLVASGAMVTGWRKGQRGWVKVYRPK